MAGQICPIFERESGEKINLIGAWMQFPVNLKLVPDEANFLEIGHIAPMLSALIRNETCRKVNNNSTDVGHGCKFLDGAFIMGNNHPAPNQPGGLPDVDFDYVMKQNDGVIILVRTKLLSESQKNTPKVINNEITKKKWWQFWK